MTDDDNKPQRHVSLVHGYRYSQKGDGSIEFDEDVPPEIRADIIERHLRMLDDEGKRRELWGEIGPGAMTRLAKLFPSLREGVPGVDPWDAIELLDWLCGPAPTSGSTQAALFVLGAWNDHDWIEVAKAELPERQCSSCNGLGRLDRENYSPVKERAPGVYVQTKYDDDDNPREVEVETVSCRHCDGKGRYQPSPGSGRFNLFRAMSVWDRPHREAFLTWARFPFWP